MSGRQDQWDERAGASQPDPPDAMPVMRQQPADDHDRANGRGRAGVAGAARTPGSSRDAGSDRTGRHGPARSVFEPTLPSDDGQAGIKPLAEPAAPEHPAEPAAPERPAAPAQPEQEPRAEAVPPAAPASWLASAQSDPRVATGAPGEPPVRRIDRPVSNPKPGSWADLRQRLERLPYGHPSSPYHVDGERKPPPPRLQHLELAPPGREPSASPSRHEVSDAGQADARQFDERTARADAMDETEPSPSAAASEVSSRQNLTEPNGWRQAAAAVPSFSFAAAPESEPYPSSAIRPPLPTSEERDSRRRPGAGVPANGPRYPADDHPQAVTGHPPGRPDPLTSAPGPTSGRNQPAPTQGLRASTQARSLPVDRGPGFNTSYTMPRLASDGSWSWGPARLTREQVRIAQDGYDRFRAAEGRDLFGSYGTSGLTAKLRQMQERLDRVRLAPQSEDHALLEIDVFRARFADMLRRYPDWSPELLASRVPGALSYAFVFDTDHYADGILQVQDALEARGFELQARKNSWSSVTNRCVFTMWHDPPSQLPFEVQFHTGASLEAQQLARTSASLINDPRLPPEEAAGLRSDLASAWAALPSPPGSAQIGDYRRYGGSAPR
jgi:hypothetical protein